jgi:hypothetical protein
MVLEANYGIEITPGLLIQLEFEYFIRPGGTRSVPNAFLIGAKNACRFLTRALARPHGRPLTIMMPRMPSQAWERARAIHTLV